MKFALFILLVLISSVCAAQLTNQEIRDLKGGRIKTDNSYVYRLPFSTKSKFLLIQAYNSKMSHKNELSLDFKMKKGSKVYAAREGVVESTRKDSDLGGLNPEYISEGNHIIIRHTDGSVAWYCESCDTEVWREEWDTADELPQAAYWRACQAFNADPGLRTCAQCGAVQAAVDLDGIRWPEVADAIRAAG